MEKESYWRIQDQLTLSQFCRPTRGIPNLKTEEHGGSHLGGIHSESKKQKNCKRKKVNFPFTYPYFLSASLTPPPSNLSLEPSTSHDRLFMAQPTAMALMSARTLPTILAQSLGILSHPIWAIYKLVYNGSIIAREIHRIRNDFQIRLSSVFFLRGKVDYPYHLLPRSQEALTPSPMMWTSDSKSCTHHPLRDSYNTSRI